MALLFAQFQGKFLQIYWRVRLHIEEIMIAIDPAVTSCRVIDNRWHQFIRLL